MPSTTLRAAEPGLPSSRRSLLRGLAAAPFIGAAAFTPATALAASPDADLIAFAAKVEALAIRSYAVLTRRGDLEEEVDRLKPKPVEPKYPDKFDISFDKQPDGGFFLRNTAKPDAAAIEARYQAALEQHAVALETWSIDREKIERRIGFRAADRLYNRLYARLEAATLDLTAMEPTTLAGVVAKGRVMVAIEIDPYDDDSLNEWEAALKIAVLHDVVRIGGAA